MNLYATSWDLYLHHSAKFKDDFDYYLEFCRGQRTLELFAGYGRLTNFLAERETNIEALELSADFAALIKLPGEKVHVGNVVSTVLPRRFQRIIAAYNSFCLLLTPEDITKFFQNLSLMLEPDGLASLSYYHPDVWPQEEGYRFEYNGRVIQYTPEHDLSLRSEKRGVWIDRYAYDGKEEVHEYPVRVYESDSDLKPFLETAGLKLVDTVKNYNNVNIGEQGWVEYILQKA